MYSGYELLKQDFDAVCEDLIGLVYDRGELVCKEVYIQKDEFITLCAKDKIKLIQDKMKEKSIKYHIISSLDDIAYLTNLRGNDIECNPVFLSYMAISLDECILFIDDKKLNDDVRNYLKSQNIIIKNYEDIFTYVKTLDEKVLIDYDKTSTKLANAIKVEK